MNIADILDGLRDPKTNLNDEFNALTSFLAGQDVSNLSDEQIVDLIMNKHGDIILKSVDAVTDFVKNWRPMNRNESIAVKLTCAAITAAASNGVMSPEDVAEFYNNVLASLC